MGKKDLKNILPIKKTITSLQIYSQYNQPKLKNEDRCFFFKYIVLIIAAVPEILLKMVSIIDLLACFVKCCPYMLYL